MKLRTVEVRTNLLHRTSKNYYHAHRVLLPDGSNFTFKINNKKAGSNRTGELPGDRTLIAESVELASADSLANQDEDVKAEQGTNKNDAAEDDNGREI